MRGHVTRKSGRKAWNVVVDLGRDPQTGKRQQKWPGKDQARGGASRVSVSTSLVVVDAGVVFQEPKTATGRRSVPIPPETVAALKAHRKAQLAEKMCLGPDYADDDLVFSREDGTRLHPTMFSRRFDELVGSAQLRRIRLHDLRHTFATLALQAHVPVKVVSEILGHASVTIT